MKSNVILKSSDRDLFGVIIRQSTDKMFLSVTDLQKSYEKARWVHGWSDRRISDILQNTSVQERLYYLLTESDLVKTSLSAFMEISKKEGIVKLLKKLNVWKTTGKGDNKQVVCNPYVWILLAMELNPMIYAKVVMWLTDSLVFDRIDAGTEYKPMNSAIKTIVNLPNYPEYAIKINKAVFGTHISGIRNIASSKELKKIADIERSIITAIEMKWINNETQLLEYLNKIK